MNKLVILLTFAASASSAWADSTIVTDKAKPTAQPTAKISGDKATKRVQMSDAELDKVTAGVTTVIFNPGRAFVQIFHRNETALTCVNCF